MNEETYFEGVKSYKLLAKKEVGQNFLVDPSIAKRIVSLLEATEGEKILEIGCGAGSLTYFLSEGPAKSEAIDIDEGLLLKLNKDFEGNSYLNIHQGNAMKFDYSPYDKIIGNLPYYITTGIIENALLGAKEATRMVFMVQKEAADRLLAKPRSKDYSALGVYLQYVAKARKAFSVPRTAFLPMPNVDSTVLCFEIDPEKHNQEAEGMYRLAEKLFLNRRKTVYNNLRSLLKDEEKAKKALETAGISPTARPEELVAKDYFALLKEIAKE
ncbi:MAG: ribosomal RNA small subunit methyltransferase A [Bacilli bacterium]|nr:ribosomal RNA small subunit methyltransferase A [Bacilli bacterium]